MKSIGKQISDAGIVPVFFHADIEVAKKALAACAEGGASVFEFTNRSPEALRIYVQLKQFADAEFPAIQLGIGSIKYAHEAVPYLEAGTAFLVGPNFDEGVLALCKEAKVSYLPGAMTPTEILYAYKHGVEVIKLFPGELVGPNYVKAVFAPCRNLVDRPLMLMVTGGVSATRESLESWFNAGVCAVGMGSPLFTADIMKEKAWDKLTIKVRDTLSLLREIKKQ